jgi:hypothetical protein
VIAVAIRHAVVAVQSTQPAAAKSLLQHAAVAHSILAAVAKWLLQLVVVDHSILAVAAKWLLAIAVVESKRTVAADS